MLSRIGNNQMCQAEVRPIGLNESLYARNEQEDMKKAIDYLYEFKEKLSKLNPLVVDAIESMLQRFRY